MPFYGGTKRVLMGAPAPVFLPPVGVFASLGAVSAAGLPNRTVTGVTNAGPSSKTSPLKYNTLTLNAGSTLKILDGSYAAIFIWCNRLVLGGGAVIRASGQDGESASECTPTQAGAGGSGGSGGGGGGAGSTGCCSYGGGGGQGGSGDDGDPGATSSCCIGGGNGGTGFGTGYTDASFLPGGYSTGAGGAGYGGGGQGGDSVFECFLNGSPAGGGGGGGGGLVYVVANDIIMTSSALTLSNLGGNPGLNADGNLYAYGGGGGVNMLFSKTKTGAGSISSIITGGGADNGSCRYSKINADLSLTTLVSSINQAGTGIITYTTPW